MNKKQMKTQIAALMALTLILGGTYAWQSFDQDVINESAGIDADVGARLHNDFNGTDADVYVENYATATGTTIYTRVRLQEYFEYGTDAGLLTQELAPDQVKNPSITILRGDQPAYTGSSPDIDHKDTWDIYLHQGNDSQTGTIRDYMTIAYGDINNPNQGAKAYMPTFNKDFENNTPDINGALGDGGNRYDGIDSYSQYTPYTIGQVKEAEATYNIQSQIAADKGTATILEEHTADYTHTSYVITMSEWIDQSYPIGPFWVYDTDGWAYWAQGLAPQSATGLLVDEVITRRYVDTDHYYGLHVVAQSASKGDWGTPVDGSTPAQGMYESSITEDALYLLDTISGEPIAHGIMTMTMEQEYHQGESDPVQVVTLGEDRYYVLDQRTVTSVDVDGYSLGTVDATLLWAAESVMTTSYHTSEDVSWETSYMRSTILPSWLATQSVIGAAIIRVPVVTDGYYLTADSYESTAAVDELTYDQVFLLSQMEVLATYGINGSGTAISTTSHQWLRSPSGEDQLRYIDGTLGSISTTSLLATDTAGVRPAFWITSDTIVQ